MTAPVTTAAPSAPVQPTLPGTQAPTQDTTVSIPQAFLADVLRRALREGDLAAATDDASLVEAMGGRVTVVPGDPRLLKVTGPEDVERALALLAAGA